jgi:hypothetical protein
MKKLSDLTDSELIELAKLRLVNKSIFCDIKVNPTKITILNKSNRLFGDEIELTTVSFVVKSKEWADEMLYIDFDKRTCKFYINEFLYLQEIGLTF